MSTRSATKQTRSLLRQWRQRLQELPTEPEHSIPLRVLVQALVTVGIVATDVASADITGTIGMSVWAVPISVLGASWSWYRRRDRNIPTKFCIAVGMLIALAVFFLELWAERYDTRLALTRLLIHLQVLHSFDLPRRKDLGYSAVIGLILIGVSATLSQTFAFAPLLLAFLAIAIPVLILDYRSRLGLITLSFKQVNLDLSPKRLGVFLLITVGLGLAIFLLLPRFPGYQIRTFPMSAPIDFPGQFDQTAILNPGYVREGTREGNGTGTGGVGETEGAGAVDENFYYGFNSQMNQNLRGEMTPRVVMRVRSQAPGFWRVLAFDRYTGQGWQISRNEEEQVKTIERPSWSFRFTLPWTPTLNRTRDVVQSYTIVSDLPNLIPALYEAKELYFPTEQVALDQEGGFRSPVPLSEGLTYTVVSEVPYRDRTLLRQSPNELLPYIKDFYLQVPETIADRVRQKTEAALASSPNSLPSASEKALFLAQYLKQNYRIRPDLPFFELEEDLVEAFLFKYEGGYPDHFSTVLTVMLRSIGIPARLVVGFAPGEFNPFTGFYIVKNIDAYAITEVYFPKYGWFTFDPIPGHELFPPSIEESKVFGTLQQFWNWIAGWLPSPVTGAFNAIFERIGAAIGWFIRLFTRGWLGWLTGLGLLTILGFLGWLGWTGWRSWRYRRWLSHLPPMEAIYQQMLRSLATQGIRKPTCKTPFEYAREYGDRYPGDRATLINEISQAYVSWRYGGKSQDLAKLKQHLRTLQQGHIKSIN
ncbi:MAG: DUF3488 domain-containing protein [Cyanobacteria bacterium RU_5_0]|nr:DUF3488 domain-containing protein [Cyanobacteria bacterium RU_5_0]